MKIDTFELERINYDKKEHLDFLKELMDSSGMSYLWDLANANLDTNRLGDNYIVIKDKEKIGYVGISEVIEAINGRTVSIYYAIDEKYRGQKYGEQLVKVISNNLLSTNKVDCIVAQVDINNKASQHVLINNGYSKIYEDDEDMKFIQKK